MRFPPGSCRSCGRRLASTGSQGDVLLWDLSVRPVPEPDPLNCHQILALAFAANGKALATASSDRSVLLWDVTGATPRK